ncbi:beta-ketoacyl-ACP synthase III [Streptomyces mesophilus]|uniref:beta-ketoacyl-ACP synthase III n=1 Tax=Streptomyces mesophilus TaxID=1775132 RepID=UPI002E2982DF|nr:beta-ketoacyl-ACP synthase III [Streptomyces mesophilus]
MISGMGGCLPSRVVDNDQLATELGVSDEWIRSRTGISTRRRVEPGMGTADLAVSAGLAALESADAREVGMVIVATTTPDRTCPSTAPEVAWRLGLGNTPAVDLNAACSGFVYALTMASAQIRSGEQDSILVIGADAFSTIVDPLDRNTAIVFGDGAGAVVVRHGDMDEPGAVLATHLGSDGSGSDFAAVAAGGSRMPRPDDTIPRQLRYVDLNGRQIYLQAIRRMTASTLAVLERVDWTTDKLEALVAHQANQRILDAVGKKLGLPGHLLIGNIREVGNTAAGSVPLAMTDAASRGAVDAGARTVLTAFGAGLTWGAIALSWPDLRPVVHAPQLRHPSEQSCPAGHS